MQKNIYAVLGMTRSGTSAITKGLSALGIDLGDQLSADTSCNAKGIFEDTEIVREINRRVAIALNNTWESISRIDSLCINNDKLTDLKHKAARLLQQRMTTTQHWAFKDPRTSKILPFWQDVFNMLAIQDHYIITVRNPLASAYSWQKVTGLEVELGLLSWLTHLMSAIEGTTNKKRLVVSYELLLQNPELQLERIKQTFKIPPLSTSRDIQAYASQFIDKKLQHEQFTEMDLHTHPLMRMAPTNLSLYNLLMRLGKDEISFDSDLFLTAWDEIKNEFSQYHSIYNYMDTLLKQNKQLERENRTIRKSLPWKMIYPLRKIDDALRLLRKKNRYYE